MQRELVKYKHEADLLKNFEKEYIKLSKHHEIKEEEISEIKRKHVLELKQKEEDIETEIKRRMFRLDEDKNKEYEFLTENHKKVINNLEKSNSDYKKYCYELEAKNKHLKDNIESISEKLDNVTANHNKTVKNLNNQLEEKKIEIKTLRYNNSLKN